MSTQELTEALARLNQDGETAIAKAAQIELGQLTTRIVELETFLQKMVEKCEECDEGFVEYQPSGLDGWLPTGDANFVTEPCWNCSEARNLLAKVQS